MRRIFAVDFGIWPMLGARLGWSPEGFAQIQKLSGVPDLGAAFANKNLTASQLLDLRYSKHCQALRNWLSEGRPGESAEEIIARYVENISKRGLIDSFPAKILRFAAISGWGLAEPLSGSVAGFVDTFLLSKWFAVKSPQLFLRQAKVILANPPVMQKPNMKGRNRNSSCSCGSGKKSKNCCGR